MSELRHDPIQKRWVIIATERSRRPTDFRHEEPQKQLSHVESCPFCEGNEDKTPPEIFAIRKPGSRKNGPGWELRVFPNKFPALRVEGDIGRRGLGIYDMMNGVGAHEVIVETKNHSLHMGDMPVSHLKKVVSVYKSRILDLGRDTRLRYTLVFKNHGAVAGASLMHPHTQLIATSITPRTISQELDSGKEHFLAKERCLFCDIINQELALKERIIYETREFIVLAPFASRFPFECAIYPRRHSHDYTLMNDAELYEFARVLKATLYKLKVALNDPPYNFVIHTAPYTTPRPGKEHYWKTLPYDYHWHIEIIPRLTRVAGFEWGTGFYINTASPEMAAEFLQNVELPEGFFDE